MLDFYEKMVDVVVRVLLLDNMAEEALECKPKTVQANDVEGLHLHLVVDSV